MATIYHDGSRDLQDRYDTRRIADRIGQLLVSDVISDHDRAFIESRDMFFLATADAAGLPNCSYKGGEPGFVRVACCSSTSSADTGCASTGSPALTRTIRS